MGTIPCTVGILTFNSGQTLRRALESVKDFAEIIICDGGSTDDTLAIAAAYGCTILSQDRKYQNEDGRLSDYAGVRNQCIDAAHYDWFFYIDSDECATPELCASIRATVIATEPEFLIYNISPRIVLDERRVIEHSSNYPGWQKRFFNLTTGARFRKAIHERIEYDAIHYPAGYLGGHWHYFITSATDADKTARYIRMDVRLYRTKHLNRFLRLVWEKLSTIVKVAIKTAWNYIRYGRRGTMPLALEMRRISYQWYILCGIVRDYLHSMV